MRDKSLILADKSEFIDQYIESYCSNSQLKVIREKLNERNYNVNETDITYRMIGHWDVNNLLPVSLRENSGWRKFTFVEMVWLRIIKHLREFGLSLDKIAFVKECVMQVNEKTGTYDTFEYYIFESWRGTLDPYLIVAHTGYAEIATLSEMKSVANMIGQHDVILISLDTIIAELGFQTNEKQDIFNLTNEQRELLSEVQSSGDKEIKIKVNKGKMLEMESTSSMTALMAGEIRKQMKDQGLYGNISIPFEEGIPQLVKVTKRKRFKK